MASPDNCRKADDSYRALSVERSVSNPALHRGAPMTNLPKSLVIALWAVGALCIVGLANE